MILLLEAGKTNLINIEKGINSFSDEELLSKGLDYLRLTSLEFKSSITKIFLVNTNENDLTEKDIEEYRKNPYFLQKDNDEIDPGNVEREKDFLGTIQIFNRSDLGIKNELDPFFQNFDVSSIIKKQGKKTIVGYSEFLTPSLANILSMVEGCELYAESYFGLEIKGSPKTIQIEKVNEYLSFYEILKKQQSENIKPYQNIPELFSSAFILLKRSGDPQVEQRHFHDAYLTMIERRSQRLLLVGGDKFLLDKFLQEVQTKLGIFDNYDCSEGTYEIKIKKAGCIFHDVDKLTRNKRTELLSELAGWKYRKKIIILTTTNVLEDLSLFGFNSVRVPSTEDCKNYLNVFMALLLREKMQLHLVGDSPQRSVFVNLIKSTILNDFLHLTPSLTEMDEMVESFKYSESVFVASAYVDFWYGLKLYLENKYTTKAPERVISENLPVEIEPQITTKEIMSVQSPIATAQYKFVKMKNKKYHIVFNGEEIELKNEDVDGLYYIHEIIKRASKDPIKAKTLYAYKEIMVDQKEAKRRKAEYYDDSEDSELNVTEQKNFVATPIVDKLALKEVKNKIEDYKKELTYLSAEESEERDELEEMIKKGEKYIRDNTKPNGKAKILPEGSTHDDQKNKKAIDRRIKIIKDEVKTKYPGFYSFLEASIHYNYGDYSYSYIHKNEIDWVLD